MEKDTFRERIKKSIDELFASIDELDSKKDELKDKTKAKYSEIMAEVKKLESVLEARHRRAQEADDPNWEEAKKAFKQSAKSFREAFENLASYLKKSPPPPEEEKRPDYEI
jgi:SMC interacting uncharacterized protein involved in chromosome segregation